MAKRNNALESMKKWMEFIPQCLQPQNKQVDAEESQGKQVEKKSKERR
ncbi:hypothetical protein [Proteus cibi]|nr:hypothetical protein [Proteus cibi]